VNQGPGLSLVLAVVQCGAQARRRYRGRQEDCGRCARHVMANGSSVKETTPNLAARRAGYLGAQLKAYKMALANNRAGRVRRAT
jgi:cytochrome c553